MATCMSAVPDVLGGHAPSTHYQNERAPHVAFCESKVVTLLLDLMFPT